MDCQPIDIGNFYGTMILQLTSGDPKVEAPSQVSPKHSRFIEIAANMAKSVPFNHRHGAVVVSGGRILGKGFNDYIRNRHAEICAMGKSWASELKDATLYIVRLRKEQPYGLSRPCPECLKSIRAAGIKRIVFSTNDPSNPIVEERL